MRCKKEMGSEWGLSANLDLKYVGRKKAPRAESGEAVLMSLIETR